MGVEATRGGLTLPVFLLAVCCGAPPEEPAPPRIDRQRGGELYRTHCAICHGQRGDGEGLRKMGLSTKPRNFTDPAWRSRTKPQQVYSTIQNGMAGTSMPAFPSLSDQDKHDLADYVLSLSK